MHWCPHFRRGESQYEERHLLSKARAARSFAAALRRYQRPHERVCLCIAHKKTAATKKRGFRIAMQRMDRPLITESRLFHCTADLSSQFRVTVHLIDVVAELDDTVGGGPGRDIDEVDRTRQGRFRSACWRPIRSLAPYAGGSNRAFRVGANLSGRYVLETDATRRFKSRELVEQALLRRVVHILRRSHCGS